MKKRSIGDTLVLKIIPTHCISLNQLIDRAELSVLNHHYMVWKWNGLVMPPPPAAQTHKLSKENAECGKVTSN